MKHRLIDQVMNRDVVTTSPEVPFKEVADLLARHAISGVPVVDRDDKVLGVVSETDLMSHQAARDDDAPRPWYALRRRAKSARAARTKAGGRTAGDLMTSPAVTIGPRRTVAEAARTMAAHRVERLPVIDEEGRLMGIVTRSDLLSVFRRPDGEVRDEIVEDVLVRTLWLAPHTIDVRVLDGVVTLTGKLQRRSEVPIAIRLTGRVDGVVSVIDHLSYQEDDSHLRPTEQALHGITEEWLRKI
ncbi:MULTISPECIES: CBS domain-containing protein [Streptomyces]|uniref:CBS domain-containing protein n=3 Tax=Streptomyces rimosus TaxID=1927 RepID=L8EXC2_STRR1|nr:MULTISPECIES: CBS domain-containing protein [Streptomyces]KOG70139.1 CBS domain protein [Kitasatospora aureofaciens]MYT48320.1 CBS domain-containing protein [Streptomyces sp. SID5471]KOT33929.1 CBS domain protein [Streptomyces rimosus subsp. rimosus]KOT34246.1 CBS domain protein [Streptomyces sp. NRRL WC-3701]KOT58280.1 CBS domain protein [Streptomyces rimosus subsp. rimosus]